MTQIDMEKKFRIGFLEEASDLLEEANESILRAESEGDLELFNAVFRSIHTIKGSAGGFGYDNMSEFAHHLETLLDKLRNGDIKIDGDITDLLLRGVDVLFFEMVDCGKENKPFDKDLSELEEQYENMTDNKSAAVEAVAEEDTTAAITVDADIAAKLREAHPGFGKPYKIDVAFTDEMLENGYDPITLYSNIREISDYFINIVDVSSVPSSEEIEPYKLYLRPATYIISDASIEELLDLAFEPDIMTVHEISLDGAADEKTYVADEPSAEESEIDSDDSQESLTRRG